jgi:hypothetical protein
MGTCCDVDGATGRAGCPSCGRQGKAVSRATVGALARLEVDAPRLAGRHYRFCETASCAIVYFVPGGVRIARDDVRVAVHHKDGGPGVPLCYCFGYTRARLFGEGRRALTFVRGEVIAGRCACDLKNPSGRCCLGDLRRYLRAVAADQPEEAPS